MIDPVLVIVVMVGGGLGSLAGLYITSRWLFWVVMGDHLDA